MRVLRSTPRVLPLALSLVLAGGALAQKDENQPEQTSPPSFSGTVFVLDHVALDQFFVDPKDQALSDALGMIPARIRELPMQVRQMPPEAAGLLHMVVTALARPGRLAVTYSETPTGGAFGYGVEFSVLTKDKTEADQMQARLSAMIAQGGNLRTQPSKRFEGMTDIQTPVAVLSFGPRKAADGWRYEIIFGTMQNPDAATAALPEPAKGLTPTIRGYLDLGGALPALAMAEGFAGNRPEVQENLNSARAAIGGNHPMQIAFQAGYTPTESVSITRVTNIPDPDKSTLAAADLAAVPADVVDVILLRKPHPEQIIAGLRDRFPPFAEGLERFQEATGVDLEQDLLGSVGGTVGLYLSDSTGGGSIGSAVFMIGIRDHERLTTALTKLSAAANQLADRAPIGPGYIKLTPWTNASAKGAEFISLRFPGLPVPLELSIATTDKWLILAPTPQAAVVAARQTLGAGDEGLTANREFAAVFNNSRKLNSLSFTDTRRNLRQTYPLLSLVGSMISNAVRSPTDPTREPGMVVPIYPELVKNVRASVSMTYWDGEARITETHGDRSILVQSGAAIGELGALVPAIAVPAAIGGIMQQAQQERRRHGFGWIGGDPNAAVLAVATEAIPELKMDSTLLSLASEAAGR